jgi:hypothetical protein
MRVASGSPGMIAVLVLAITTRAPAEQKPSIAMLDRIACAAVLTDGQGEHHISETSHLGRYLYVGDSVQCNSAGFFTVLLGAEQKEIKKRTFTAKARSIQPQPAQHARVQPAPYIATQQREFEKLADRALRFHNSAAGTRGRSLRIISPGPNSVVWPEHFVIRWVAETHPGKIALSIHAPGLTPPLWHADGVDGTVGSLDSSDLHRAIASYRESGSTDALLTLEWRSSTRSFDVPFSLLSPEEDKNLNNELEIWKQAENELLRAVGRAYSFASRGLFWDAAHEYEEALKLAPHSCDLVKEAMAVEEQANHWDRVQELDATLKSTPGGCPDRNR